MVVDELPPCDKKVFLTGKPVALIEADPDEVENWVRLVASMANIDEGMDFHFTGPLAQVLLDDFGDPERRIRVENAVYELEPLLGKSILKRFTAGEPGIYRRSPRKVPERFSGR